MMRPYFSRKTMERQGMRPDHSQLRARTYLHALVGQETHSLRRQLDGLAFVRELFRKRRIGG